jgi:type I restriction enzyme R subunit
MRLHLRPLGVRQTPAIHEKLLSELESQTSEPGNPKSQQTLVGAAANVFNGELITLLDGIRRDHEQTIDHDTLDTITNAAWAGDTAENARIIATDFEGWLTDHSDQITALTIYYTQPARRAEVTFAMIKDLLATLKADRPRLAPDYVWRAYAHLDDVKTTAPASELTQLVALIRRACGLDAQLTPNEDRARRNFQNWILRRHSGAGEKFTEAQMDWLRLIRDHISTSFRIEAQDLDFAPFDAQGGLGRMHALFGADYEAVMDEMNEALSA